MKCLVSLETGWEVRL